MTYLFAAYTVIWVVLFGYIFFLARRVSEVRRELDALKDTLEAKGRER